MNYEKLDSIVLSLKDELLADMKRWIAVPSVLSESAGPNAPFGKANREMLDLALETARKYGFEARDVDGYAGDVSMGSGEKTLGILCHLDVVPAGDSWTKDPWGAEIEDGKIYGRGAMDDKGPALIALYAMRAVRDAGIPLTDGVRLIWGCDEETGMNDMRHYASKYENARLRLFPGRGVPGHQHRKGRHEHAAVQIHRRRGQSRPRNSLPLRRRAPQRGARHGRGRAEGGRSGGLAIAEVERNRPQKQLQRSPCPSTTAGCA